MTKSSTQTWQRIVDGALMALARRGQQRFSMTDVCTESGVSRGTLYRYFASKEDLIEAIEERLVTSLREELTSAIADQPAPEVRIRVVAEAIARHRADFPALTMLSRNEPGLVLERLGARFEDLVGLLHECLHPALAESAQVRSGAVTEEQIARVVLHSSISFGTLPTSTAAEVTDLAATLEGLLGIGQAAEGLGETRRAG